MNIFSHYLLNKYYFPIIDRRHIYVISYFRNTQLTLNGGDKTVALQSRNRVQDRMN